MLYLWVFPYHAAVNNPNENVRLYMTVAIVDDGTFAINRIEQLWGYVNDKAIRAGRLYSSKAPGTSYLGVPVYWALTKITGRSTRPPPPALPTPNVHPTASSTRRAELRPPIEKTQVLYILRLFTNVFPALVFAWFFHRFLGARTRSAALREAVFFSTMAGSALMAYSLVFVSHAQNAFCFASALMALATVHRRDSDALTQGVAPKNSLGLLFLAGLFGAGATLFEYPAALASASVALWIIALASERRPALVALAGASLGLAIALYAKSLKLPAVIAASLSAVLYTATLSPRGFARLITAGLGGALPTGLTLLYHHRCFGNAFKPGYDFLENPTFREETSHGFYGATAFSWEAALRLWLDPAYGLIPCSLVLILCLAGVGSSLSLSLEARGLRSLRRALTALTLSVSLAAAIKLLLLAKNHTSPVNFTSMGPWVCVLLVALIGLSAIRLPKPRHPEPALALTMLLAAITLTRLIGAMNNWRGGWQVGPRYLATLIPAVAIFTLWGADTLISRATSTSRRTVTLFASGATLSAVLLTGLPSAWFPHIPLEYGSPFFEMIVPLIRDGFFPHSVGEYFGLHGPLAMVGFALGLIALAFITLRGDETRPMSALAHSLGALAVCVTLLVPFALLSHPSTAPVTRYVKTAFEPKPSVDTPTPSAHESLSESSQRALSLARSGRSLEALTAWQRSLGPGSPATEH